MSVFQRHECQPGVMCFCLGAGDAPCAFHQPRLGRRHFAFADNDNTRAGDPVEERQAMHRDAASGEPFGYAFGIHDRRCRDPVCNHGIAVAVDQRFSHETARVVG